MKENKAKNDKQDAAGKKAKKEKKELNINMGDRIRIGREDAKYTQEYFAEVIDVSVQYVSDLERGVVGTSIPTLVRICQSLGVSSDYILFGKEHDTLIEVTNMVSKMTPHHVEFLKKYIALFNETFSTGKPEPESE